MDIQADIQWIKNELNHVENPGIISAIKNLLTDRKTQKDFDSVFMTTKEDLLKNAMENVEGIEADQTHSFEDFKREVREWMNQKSIK